MLLLLLSLLWLLYIVAFYTCGICVFLTISRIVDVFIWYFLNEVPNSFWIGIRVYFLSEDYPKGSFGFFDDTLIFGSLLLVFI